MSFPDELRAAGLSVIRHVEAADLPALDSLGGDKAAALQELVGRLSAAGSPLRENLEGLRELGAVRIIEGRT